MRKLFQLMVVIAAPILSLGAQQSEATVFHPRATVIGGFGGPTLDYGTLGGEGATFVGAEGGIVLNHRWLLGVSEYGTGSSSNFYGRTPSRFDGIDVGYASANVGYVMGPLRALHYTVGMGLGGGRAESNGVDFTPTGRTSFTYAEPSVRAEWNMLHWMRASVGGSWRLISGTPRLGLLEGQDFGGPMARFALSFGKF